MDLIANVLFGKNDLVPKKCLSGRTESTITNIFICNPRILVTEMERKK